MRSFSRALWLIVPAVLVGTSVAQTTPVVVPTIPVITDATSAPSVPTLPGGFAPLPSPTPEAGASVPTSDPNSPASAETTPQPPSAESSAPAPSPSVPQVAVEGCPAQVPAAISAAQAICAETASGQACVGNGVIEATPISGAEIALAQSGDRTPFENLSEVRVRTLDTPNKLLSLLVAKPFFPTSLGSSAESTLIVIGDATLSDTGDTRPQAAGGALTGSVIADFGMNVRRLPDANSEVLWQLARGNVITITGQSTDKVWLRIEIPNQFRGTGWVYAPYIEVEGGQDKVPFVDPNVLPTRVAPAVASSGGETRYGTMQSFSLLSAPPQPACADAPPSGVLLQSPNSLIGRLRLRVNGVQIDLNGTIFMQATPNDALIISVLEGEVGVVAQGAPSSAPANFQIRVAMDGNLQAAGAPLPDVFDPTPLSTLPANLLPRLIALPEAANAEQAPVVDSAASPTPSLEVSPTGDAASPSTPSLAPSVTPMPASVGSLSSDEAGELCGAAEVALSGTSNGFGPAVEVGGIWRAKAGTIITISVSGGTLQPIFGDYIRLTAVTGIVARSADQQSLSHSFATDTTFTLALSAANAETVTARIRCGS